MIDQDYEYGEDDSTRDLSKYLAMSPEELDALIEKTEKELGIYKEPEEQKEKIA